MGKLTLCIKNDVFVIRQVDKDFLSSLFYQSDNDEYDIGDGNITSIIKDCQLLWIWNKDENPPSIFISFEVCKDKYFKKCTRHNAVVFNFSEGNLDKKIKETYKNFDEVLKWREI